MKFVVGQKGFPALVAILIVLGVVVVGGTYFLLHQRVSITPTPTLNKTLPSSIPTNTNIGKSTIAPSEPTEPNQVTSSVKAGEHFQIVYASQPEGDWVSLGALKPKPTQLILYDSATGSQKVIKEYPSTYGVSVTRDVEDNLGGATHNFDKNGNFYFLLTDNSQDPPRVTLVKSDINGNTNTLIDFQSSVLTEGYYGGRGYGLALDGDRNRAIWCPDSSHLKVFNIVTSKVSEVKNDYICELGFSSGPVISRKDENTIYYVVYFRFSEGFVDTMALRRSGGYNEEEIGKVVDMETNQLGLHKIDLNTGKDSIIATSTDVVFWNGSEVNLNKKIILHFVVTDEHRWSVEVKKLQAVDFDYLTEKEVGALKQVGVIYDSFKYSLSQDGKYVFHYNGIELGNKINYFDVDNGNDYPLVTIQNPHTYGYPPINFWGLGALQKTVLFLYSDYISPKKTDERYSMVQRLSTASVDNNNLSIGSEFGLVPIAARTLY